MIFKYLAYPNYPYLSYENPDNLNKLENLTPYNLVIFHLLEKITNFKLPYLLIYLLV
jgi:hypothetical protein